MRSLSSKSGWPSVVKPAVWVLLTGVILHASALLGATYSVNRLDDPLALVINAATYCNGVLDDCSFRQAVIKANSTAGSDTILLPVGTYTLTQVGLGEGLAETGDVDARDDLTIIGDMDGSGNPTSIIQGCGGTSGVVCVGGTAWNDKFISTNKLRDTSGSLSIANVIFQNGNNTNTDLVNSPGGAVDFFGCAPEGGGCSNNGGVTFLPPSSLTISNVRFLNNTAAGCAANECGGGLVSRFGTTAISGVLFFGNTATLGRGGALALVGAKETMMVTSSTFNANHSGLEGGALSVNFQNNSLAVLNVSSSVITGNLAAGSGGGGIYVAAGGTLNLQSSRIANNTVVAGGPNGMAVEAAGTSTVNATNNWWGCNAGPSASPCDTVATVNIGTVTLPNFNPWLVLAITALPNQILVGSTSNLAADLAHNSSGGTGFSVPNGTPIAFGGTLGTDSPINATTVLFAMRLL